MKLRYTLPASRDLGEVLGYLASRSPSGPAKVAARLREVAELISRFPEAGRMTRRPPMRSMIGGPYPCLVFYSLDEDHVTIHAVRHSARDLRSMPSDRTD